MNKTDYLGSMANIDIFKKTLFAVDGKYSDLDSHFIDGNILQEYMKSMIITNGYINMYPKVKKLPFILPEQIFYFKYDKSFFDEEKKYYGVPTNIAFDNGKLYLFAGKFNGDTSRHVIDATELNVFMDNFSLSFWVKATTDNADNTDRRIVEYLGSSRVFTVMIGNDDENNNVVLRIGDGINVKEYNTGININDNTYHHMITEFKKGSIKLYIDGKKIIDSFYDKFLESALKLVIGNTGTEITNSGLIGSIDEFRIFKGTFNREYDKQWLYNYRECSRDFDISSNGSLELYSEFNGSLISTNYNYEWKTYLNKTIYVNGEYGRAIRIDSDSKNCITVAHPENIKYDDSGDFSIMLKLRITDDSDDDKSVFLLSDHPDVDNKYNFELTKTKDDNDNYHITGVMIDKDGNKTTFLNESDTTSNIKLSKPFLFLVSVYQDANDANSIDILCWNSSQSTTYQWTKAAKQDYVLHNTNMTIGGRIAKNEKYCDLDLEFVTFKREPIKEEEFIKRDGFLNNLNAVKYVIPDVFNDDSCINLYELKLDVTNTLRKYDLINDTFRDGTSSEVDFINGKFTGSALFDQDESQIKIEHFIKNEPVWSTSFFVSCNFIDSRLLLSNDDGTFTVYLTNGKLTINGSNINNIPVNNNELHLIVINSNGSVIVDGIKYSINNITLLNDTMYFGYNDNIDTTSYAGEIEAIRTFSRDVSQLEAVKLMLEGY